MTLTLPLVTGAALLDSINPCAISVLLLTVGFLISVNSNRRHILTVAGLYIFAIYLTYIFIGVGILSALTFFGFPHIMTKIGSVILIIFGFLNLGESLIPSFPIKLAIPAFIKPQLGKLIYQASYVSAFILGVLVGLFEFPCTGGPYLLILGLLHDKSTITAGTLYLLYYNLIFVAPLIIILAAASSKGVMSKIESWRHSNSKTVDLFSAVTTIILGFVIFLL
jgi:cytochrome c-type biogenesis protein